MLTCICLSWTLFPAYVTSKVFTGAVGPWCSRLRGDQTYHRRMLLRRETNYEIPQMKVWPGLQ